MSFKVLNKDEYDALSVRDQVKYELGLEAHKKQEQDKAIKDAVDAQLETVKADQAKTVAEMKADFDKAVEDAKKESASKLEELEARVKSQNAFNTSREDRVKGISEYILEKFSTPDGEAVLEKARLNIKDFNFDIEGTSKATFVKPTANGGYVSPEMAGIYGAGHDMLHARNVLRVLPTMRDLVKFLQLTPTSGTGFGYVAEGATKPTIDYTSTIAQVTIKKIAGLLDVSDEAMNDLVGFRAFIAAELPLAYLDFEDQYIFKHVTDGIFTQAQTWVPNGSVTAASNSWDKIISAATQVRLNKRNPTAAFVSPIGYQELLINKDVDNAYTYPIVIDSNGVLRVGALPVYATNILEDGEALVGDFATGAALWQNEGMNIRYSDEHKDNFATNIVTIRLESRIAVTVYKTDAFVKIEDIVPAP